MPIPPANKFAGYLGTFFIVNQYYLYASIYSFNCSYLFLQKICTDLRFDNICRNQSVLYYDCTNFFFEIEQEDELRTYGKSKEHRPSPIVGLGLFMDADGFSLPFGSYPGNQNEQTTLKPLEKKVIRDFDCLKFCILFRCRTWIKNKPPVQ